MKFVISQAAYDDLDEILDYIARDSLQNAELVKARLDAAFERLADPISIGRHSDALKNPALRVADVSGYQIIYDPTANPIVVIRVLRIGRDLRRL